MAIDTTKKIKQVTYNGTEIPLSGYDTSDATVTAGDIAKGFVAYGKNGKVTGNINTKTKGDSSMWQGPTVSFRFGTYIDLSRENIWEDQLFRKGSFITLRAYAHEFGNATAADVAKGKTFTSAAGLKVAGTAAGSSAADVTFELYNNGFNHLTVVYMSKTDGVMDTTIPNSDHMSITTSEGSMVALVNGDFNGDTINLIPDNGVSIAQLWSTENVTLFVAGAETNDMNIDVEIV